MTAQPGKYSANFNGGEYTPALHGRIDIKQYYSGAALMRNVEPVAQGGFQLAPRTVHVGFVRTGMVVVSPTSSSSALGPHSAAATIAQLNFSPALPLNVVRVTGMNATQALNNLVRIEYFDGAAWQVFGAAAYNIDTVARARTSARVPGSAVTTTAVRLQLIGAPPSATTFGYTTFEALQETGGLPAAVMARPFTFSRDQSYEFVFTNFFVDIWRGDTFVGALSLPYGDADLFKLDLQQRFDTMEVFHTGYAPAHIKRDGADHEWDYRAETFTGMPQVDLGGSYTLVTDQWQLSMTFPIVIPDPFLYGVGVMVNFTVNGEETVGALAPNNGAGQINTATFAANIVAALEALGSVGAGVICNVTGYSILNGTLTATIAFSGTANNGQIFALTARVTNTATASAYVAHTVIGSAGGEDVMSVARGWPGCGLFWQDRLAMAGFAAKKSAFLASRTGEYFDIDITVPNAAAALLHNLDTDGAEQIVRLARSLHLLLFTDAAEYFIVDRALSRSAPPTVVECSRNGIVPTVPVCKAEDQLFYIAADKADDARKGVMVFAAEYSDIKQRYVSQPISLLADHITQDIIDAAMQVFAKARMAARYFLVRQDGSMAVGVMIRGQDVTGFIRWETAGAVKSACVNGKNTAYLAVQRATAGGQRIAFERMSNDVFLDGAVTITNAPASATVSGLAMHEGAAVYALADGFVLGPFTVTGGIITLPAAASAITVGRWAAPVIDTLPIPRVIEGTTVLARPIRVHTVRGTLIGTTSLAIGANGNAPEDVPFARAGDLADTPTPPWSGPFEVGGLTDFTESGTVRFTQLRPGWLQTREIIIEAKT